MILKTNDLRDVRPIAENINDIARLEPYIKEAESLRLVDVLGAALYRWLDETEFKGDGPFEFLRDDGQVIEVTAEQIKTALFGGYWESCGCVDGPVRTRRTVGLRIAVAYIAYSRFLLNNPVNPTAFGVRYKDGEFSTKVEDSIVARTAAEAAKIGEAYLSGCIDYLTDMQLIPRCKPRFGAASRDLVIGKPGM